MFRPRYALLLILTWCCMLPYRGVSLHVDALMINAPGGTISISTTGASLAISTYVPAASATVHDVVSSASHVASGSSPPTPSGISGAPVNSPSSNVAASGTLAITSSQAQASNKTETPGSVQPSATSQASPLPSAQAKGGAKVVAFGLITILVFGVVVWAKLRPLYRSTPRNGARAPTSGGNPYGRSSAVQSRAPQSAPRRRATEDRIGTPAPAYASTTTLSAYAASAIWSVVSSAIPAGHRAAPDPEILPIPLAVLPAPPAYSPPSGSVITLPDVPEYTTDDSSQEDDIDQSADAVVFDEPENIAVE